MAVIVTGNAWTHTGSPISANRQPELWFRPNRHALSGASLLVAVDAQANLDVASGGFSVSLEADPALMYRPWMRWLTNPGENDPERWAWGYAEWPFEFSPYPAGGPIGTLAHVDLSIYTVYVGVDDPPPGFRGWWLHSGPGDPEDDATSGTGELRRVHG